MWHGNVNFSSQQQTWRCSARSAQSLFIFFSFAHPFPGFCELLLLLPTPVVLLGGLPSSPGDALPVHKKYQRIYLHTGWDLAHDGQVPRRSRPCLESGQFLGYSLHFWVPCRIRLKRSSGELCRKSHPRLASAIRSCFCHSWLVTIASTSLTSSLHMSSFHLRVCFERTRFRTLL